jgi:ankyrin repeat protein
LANHTMGELHELIESYDWEGIIELFGQQKCSDEKRHDLASQRDEEGHLALHYRELYQPGASIEAILAIINANPEALTQQYYPLHVALETMLETQDQEESEDAGYEAYYYDIVQLLLHRAPQVAQYPTNQGVLPLHLAAQLNLKGLVELILAAYPQGACISTAEHHNYSLPLHLVCQFSKSAEDITQLLQEYPGAAQYKDYWTATEEDEEDANENCVPNRYPLHHLCANIKCWTSSEESAPAKAAFLKLYQAHPEAAKSVDHMGRTPLSLLCEKVNPLQNMDSLTYLLKHSDQRACTAQDCKGRLPLHYLAENMSIKIASCHESHAFDSSHPICAWKCLVAAHPQALFCKDHQEGTPLSLLLFTKKIGIPDVDFIVPSIMHIMLLQASLGDDGMKLPISAKISMTPLPHLLAFFAAALCPTEQETMDVLKQSVLHDTANAVVDSQGNNVLHMVCIGMHWATQEDTYYIALAAPSGEETDADAESTDKGIMGQDQEAAVSSQISHEAVTESSLRQVLLEFLLSISTGEQPLVQMANRKGQLPLHILLSSILMIGSSKNSTDYITQEVAVRLLICAFPESASIDDPTTRLAPFMAAAARSALTSSFELLQSFVATTDLIERYKIAITNTHHRTSSFLDASVDTTIGNLHSPTTVTKRGFCDINSCMGMNEGCATAHAANAKNAYPFLC